MILMQTHPFHFNAYIAKLNALDAETKAALAEPIG